MESAALSRRIVVLAAVVLSLGAQGCRQGRRGENPRARAEALLRSRAPFEGVPICETAIHGRVLITFRAEPPLANTERLDQDPTPTVVVDTLSGDASVVTKQPMSTTRMVQHAELGVAARVDSAAAVVAAQKLVDGETVVHCVMEFQRGFFVYLIAVAPRETGLGGSIVVVDRRGDSTHVSGSFSVDDRS
jgi:hypothetical protein